MINKNLQALVKEIVIYYKNVRNYNNERWIKNCVEPTIQPRKLYDAHTAGLCFHDDKQVTQNGVTIARVTLRYSDKKTAGFYKELQPLIEFV